MDGRGTIDSEERTMSVETSGAASAASTPASEGSGRHRVVVIGSGFGALWATEALAKAPVDITMISMTSHHLFQPLLYQVATGVLSEGEVAPGMKSIDDALELRGRIFGSFELAELCTDPAVAEEWLTFVVVGAGPTGVEMAGQISELAHRTLRRDFRRIDPTKAHVILLDAAPAVLGAFGDELSAAATEQLRKIGVDVQLNVKVVGLDNTGVDVIDPDGTQRRIKSRCKVWAAGVSASPLGQQLAEQSDAQVDRAGRVLVNKDLTLPGHPEVFVIGDMMALDNLPGVAQVAMQGGKHAAGQIERRLRGQATSQPFKYFDKGSMATISRFSAVCSIGKRIRLSVVVAWVMWLGVHVMYLVGFRNRFTTVIHWAVSFIFRGRSQRTTTRQQIVARTLMARLSATEEALNEAKATESIGEGERMNPASDEQPAASTRPNPS